MSKKHSNHYRHIITILERLHKSHPTYNIGRHISTALDGSDVWGISDKEFASALEKYEISLNMDIEHNQEEINDIIKDGMNLERMFDEDED